MTFESGKSKAPQVPQADVHPRREPGKGRGRWVLEDDFDAPLPTDVLDAFGKPGERDSSWTPTP